MMLFLSILFTSVFTQNILLSNYLGMCSFLSMSRELKVSFGLGLAVWFVLVSTAILNWVIYHFILLPYDLNYLRYLVFIITIATFVQLLEIFIERFFQALYHRLGIFLPLITVNCAILGVSLLMLTKQYSLILSISYAIGSGLGFLLAIVLMGAIREKLTKRAKIPKPLQGAGITLIIAGLIALAFSGFRGIS